MSGFTGVVNPRGEPVAPALLSTLVKALAYRAPDGPAVRVEDSVGFGQALLRTHGPRQESPSIPTLDGNLWIVADARLDGRDDLIGQFDPDERGRLRAISGPELILHCYRRWGDDCAAHLIGDFSFAIWDRNRQRLLCARDQFGVKPFFFAAWDGHLVFSNTLECVRAHPSVPDTLNDLALADFLLFGSNKDPSTTAFAAIERLPAGHTLVFDSGSPRIQRYWFPKWGEPPRYGRQLDYVEHFRDVLRRAVADRVTSDRTAVLMSGGLDSTSVAAAARKTATQVKAFTIVCDSPIPDEERRFSAQAAEYLGMPVEYLNVDGYELFGRVDEPELRTPEPAYEPLAAIFTDHMRQVRDFSSVALSGQGGDGIFSIASELALRMIRAGQTSQLARGAWRYIRWYRRIPPFGFRSVIKRAFTGAPVSSPSPFPEWLDPDLEARLGLRERWRVYEVEEARALDRRDRPDVLTHPFWPALFETYDPGVTRIPVEVRHPLFDLRVVNYCMTLDPTWCVNKFLLRIAMQGWLPDSIRLRPKARVAGDPVALHLARCAWIDTWEPCPLLGHFVRRNSIPHATVGSSTSACRNLRPLALNLWLGHLTNRPVKGTTS
jgi:asparagine synthase (glutamine-hydrolysing)